MQDTGFGRTIQLFLVDGKPNGLRKATIHGWTGVVLVSNEANLSKLAARDEAKRTGIYILLGPDPEQHHSLKVYIGQGTNVSSRILQSANQGHEFWETAIAVTTSDDDLSKGHAEYLEARLIEMAMKADRVSLDNTQKPSSEKRKLPEADIANMEQFLLNIQVVLPVVGLEMLKEKPRAVLKETSSEGEDISLEAQFELTHKSGVNAFALEADGEFVVLEGSEVLMDTGYSRHSSYGPLKDRLKSEGVIVPSGENSRFVFAKSYAFSSPSAAAAVILDRASNGRLEWKLRGTKTPYYEWQERQANIEAMLEENIE